MNLKRRFAGFIRGLCITILAAPFVLEEGRGEVNSNMHEDPHTVALWLFDEPQYMNMTLTDAGRNQYDLRLYPAGRLVPGKFGRAVGRRPEGRGQAVAFAAERRQYPNGPIEPLKSRMSAPPEKLLSCLRRNDWTWEFWLMMRRPPQGGECLVDVGLWAFYCSFSEGGKGLNVVSSEQGLDDAVPIDKETISDGRWHHLAFSWSREESTLRCFLDGVSQGQAHVSADRKVRRPIRPQFLPGVFGEIFGNADLTRAGGREITERFDLDLGTKRGVSWSERWRGQLRAPTTGRVKFRAEADTGVRLVLAGETVINGWGQNLLRSGSVNLAQGKRYPLLLEYSHTGETARLCLFWSWPGQEEEVIPATALSHTLSDGGAESDAYRFDVALLSDQNGENACDAIIDEMCVSSIARYGEAFTVPDTFSRNQSSSSLNTAKRTGPQLLFDPELSSSPVHLGGRKHLFLDDALIERKEGVTIRQCSPIRIDQTENDFGLGDSTVLDNDGHIWLYYGGWTDSYRVATSTDGIHFHKPDLDISEWGGRKEGMRQNAIFTLPGQATFFKDGNPTTPSSERFKCTAFIMTRGIYALTSPDGIHWKRNETIMLPFDCGGGVESFWDDQRGSYVCHIRHEGHYPREGRILRLAARAETNDFLRPWPFEPDPNPAPRGAFTLPALWKELPTPFVPNASGQVYRTRANKYPWAPDAYVAFVWRYDTKKETRQTELAVSRDGRRWHFFGVSPAYLPVDLPFGDGHRAKAALAGFGLVRRGDEIWQYAQLSTAGHSAGQEALVRVVQRLDGFAALQASEEGGRALTRPIIFEGRKLELNVDADGELRVGILDEAGEDLPGLSVEDCRPIRSDAIRHVVEWEGGSSLARVAHQVVRLRFEMKNARLFAIQFIQ